MRAIKKKKVAVDKKPREKLNFNKSLYAVIKFIVERSKLFECIPESWFVDDDRSACYWPPKTGRSFTLRAMNQEEPDWDWEIYECEVVSEGHVSYSIGTKIVREKCSQPYNTSSADDYMEAAKFKREHPGLVYKGENSLEKLFEKKNSAKMKRVNLNSKAKNEVQSRNQTDYTDMVVSLDSPERGIQNENVENVNPNIEFQQNTETHSENSVLYHSVCDSVGKTMQQDDSHSGYKIIVTKKHSVSSSNENSRVERRKSVESSVSNIICQAERVHSPSVPAEASLNQHSTDISISPSSRHSRRRSSSHYRSGLSSRSSQSRVSSKRSNSRSSRRTNASNRSRSRSSGNASRRSSKRSSSRSSRRTNGSKRSRSHSSGNLSRRSSKKSSSLSSRRTNASNRSRSRSSGNASRRSSKRSSSRSSRRTNASKRSRSRSSDNASRRSRKRFKSPSIRRTNASNRSRSSGNASRRSRSSSRSSRRSRDCGPSGSSGHAIRLSNRPSSHSMQRIHHISKQQSRKLASYKKISSETNKTKSNLRLFVDKHSKGTSSSAVDQHTQKDINREISSEVLERNVSRTKQNKYSHRRSKSPNSILRLSRFDPTDRQHRGEGSRQPPRDGHLLKTLMNSVNQLIKIINKNERRHIENDRRLTRVEVTTNKSFVLIGDLITAFQTRMSLGHFSKEVAIPRGYRMPKLPIEHLKDVTTLNHDLKNKDFFLFLLNDQKQYCTPSNTTHTVTMTAFLKRFISVKVRVQFVFKDLKGQKGITLYADFPRVYDFIIDVFKAGYEVRNKILTNSEVHAVLRTVWGRSKQILNEENQKMGNY